MSILNDQTNSDEEFWNDFEKKPDLKNSSRAKKIRKTQEEPPIENQEIPKLKAQRYEQLIERIRLASKEQVSSASIYVRNQTRQENLITLKEMQEELLEAQTKILKEKDALELIIIKKNDEIRGLTSLVREQEEIITEMRIQYCLSRRVSEVCSENSQRNSPLDSYFNENQEISLQTMQEDSQKSAKNNKQNEELKLEIQILKQKYESLKEICKNCSEEAAEYLEKWKSAQSDLERLKETYESEIQSLRAEKIQIEEQLLTEKNKIEGKFHQYKAETTKELEIREVLCKKLKETADIAQEELKCAKTVLQSPRLRNKLQSSLKLYIKEIEKPSQSANSSRDFEKRLAIRTSGCSYDKISHKLNKSLDSNEASSIATKPSMQVFDKTCAVDLKMLRSGYRASRSKGHSLLLILSIWKKLKRWP
ncbi:unnamed protein product [Blepharisma stoltei]|uniref:Uncharacterized protein n=1 Tax=Blepharisma stoltei TaxID=1481888 RepID=A0AAU9KA75_9CILI|nr:unnamed protein product [Blepharisma stoltei]